MKKLSLLVFALLTTVFVMQSCKNDNDVKESAKEKLHNTDKKIAETSKSAKDVLNKKTSESVGPLTTVEFKEKSFDFGKVMDGEIVEHDYHFTNTGDEPLILKKVKASCGCTVPTWPRKPIAPGGKGVIHAKFDTKRRGRPGGAPQNKRITVTGNIEGGNVILTLKGLIDKKEDPNAKIKKTKAPKGVRVNPTPARKVK
jgi:hypothetical protein